MEIVSQQDKELLEMAKDEAYKKGFHEGVLLVGQFKGRKVSEVKGEIRNILIKNNEAFQYYEPNGYVLSRSN
jgi:leucyl-tRNA synthetase